MRRSWAPALAIVLTAVFLGACSSDEDLSGFSDRPPDTSNPLHAGGPENCAEAFASAASVDAMRDTHSDLFPAFDACTDEDEWVAASNEYPEAIDGADPIAYAMTVCANNQAQIGDSTMCVALNEPAEPSTLERSGKSGLFGVPLPKGTQLIEKKAGSADRDPFERYKTSATNAELNAFFSNEWPKEGWSKDGTSTDTGLFFQKGDVLLGVLMSSSGGTFTISGS